MSPRIRQALDSRASTTQSSDIGADAEEPPGTIRHTSRPQQPWGGTTRPPVFASPVAIHPTLPFPTPAARPRPSPRRKPQAETDLTQLDVVVLYNLALGLERGRPEDILADEETAQVAANVAAALKGQVAHVHGVPVWDDPAPALRNFDPQRTVVFNLVEGLGGRAMTDSLTPQVLEALGFRYTGASHLGLRRAGDKWATKRTLQAAGLAVPRCQLFRKPKERAVTVPLPAIVKPVGEGGSFGITQDSVVRDRASLLDRVEACFQTYGQPVLADEFIPGREINAAVWGNGQPEVLPISEIIFEWTDDPLKQIVTFDAKWRADSAEYWQTPGRCPADLTPDERSRIERAATETYRLLGLKGYCRVDMRLRDGVPYILEVNANPDLAPDAGFFRSASTAGHTYTSMVVRILQLALCPAR